MNCPSSSNVSRYGKPPLVYIGDDEAFNILFDHAGINPDEEIVNVSSVFRTLFRQYLTFSFYRESKNLRMTLSSIFSVVDLAYMILSHSIAKISVVVAVFELFELLFHPLFLLQDY